MIKTAITFMLGCLLFLQLHNMPNINCLWLIVPVIALLINIKMRLFGLFLLGLLWTFFQANLVVKDHLSANLEGKDIVVTGVIANIPKRDGNRINFEFKPDISFADTLPKKLRLNWYKPLPSQFNADEYWQLTVRLKQIHSMSNPGSFDYESWLFQRHIGATGYVRTDKNNYRLSPAPHYSINNIRQSLLNKLQQYLNSSHQLGLIEGLTTGVRDKISRQQWQTLRASGTSHLLAISGLHIGLAATIGFFCFRWLWSLRSKNLLLLPASEFAAIGGFLVALFYASLAGFSIPTQRALFMVATVMVAVLIRRPIAPSSLLAFSMLIILLWDPFAVLSAGFWLSFSAVALILFISQNRLPFPRWQWLKIHTFIAFGLTPLLLLFFLQTSLISPIANLIAIPFISLIIVPILLLACLMLWLYEPLAALLLHLADKLLSLFWPLLDTLAALPFSHWSISPLPFYYYLTIGISSLLLISPRGFPAKWLGLVGLLPLFLFNPARPKNGEFWFTLLDVGQGLAAVVQTHSHALVFDTGPKFSDSFNTGTAIVQPFLHYQGIKRINTLIVSHGDNDHIGGARPLIKVIPVDQILSSVPNRLPNAQHCYSGQSWQWDDVDFKLFNPDKQDVGSENNLSCVLKISNTIGSVLLTGDIEQATEKRLIQRYGEKLQSTLLVAPHHGSKTSSSINFIQTVKPKIVLFPVGYHNRYHFPNKDIVARYAHNGISSLASDEQGAISVKFSHNLVSKPIAWRQKYKRIWTTPQ